MKLLVIGANGQLGWEVCRRGEKNGFAIVPLDLPGFDITDYSKVKKAISHSGGKLVINAAAYTEVDDAESEPEVAFAVNRDGPANLAASCAEIGIPIIHISTDYVFDGNKKGPYLETEPVSPLGVYGKSKAAGEKELRGNLKEHIILRTAWLYGIHGDNFVKTMLRLGREKDMVHVVEDQYGCPTFAADLAEAIMKIASDIKKERDVMWGTYHFCGKGVTTWHSFAQAIFDLARQHDSFRVKKVIPIPAAEYSTKVKRPACTVLDCSLFIKHFAVHPRPWQEALADMMNMLFSKRDAKSQKEL